MHDIIKGRMRGKAIRMHLLSDLMKNRSYMEVKQEAQDRAGRRASSSFQACTTRSA